MTVVRRAPSGPMSLSHLVTPYCGVKQFCEKHVDQVYDK
jgi:hypothetical protein